MVCARSAAMAFNRLADRRLDAANPRTAGRHLPAGLLSPAAVWSFFLISSAGFLAATLIFYFSFDNPWPLWLALPVLLFVCAYSYTKRFTAPGAFLAGRVAAAGSARGLDRRPRYEQSVDAARPRRRGVVLGGGVRHPLRLPGRGFRSQGETAQRSGGARRGGESARGAGLSSRDAWAAARALLDRWRRTSASSTWPGLWPRHCC